MLNTLKVGVLLTILTALVLLVGRMFGGTQGMIIAFGLAMVMNLGSYWFSDKIVLKMTGAQPVTPQQAPELYRMTENLVQRAGLPMPKLYIVDDPSPNAFATGRNPSHAVVAVNTGLLDLLDKREVEGVVAHELGHVAKRDTLTMAIVATLAGALMVMVQIARFSALFGLGGSSDRDGNNVISLLALIIVGPLAAVLIQSAVSREGIRSRRFCRAPDGFARRFDQRFG